MTNFTAKLMGPAEAQALMAKAPDQLYAVSGDESVLARLPKGNWIGGTITNLMTDESGGVTTREQLLVQPLPSDGRAAWRVLTYDANTISRITDDAPDNGYTFLLIPAFSDAHLAYGKDAPGFKDLYQHPIIGWITGVHLDDLATKEPKVFNGTVGEVHSDLALACHVPLPADKMAFVDIVNIFARSAGPDMRFATDGFTVTDCSIGGETTNFARWLAQKKVDTRIPLVADYHGALVNVSFRKVDADAGKVALCSPVFRDRMYRMAKPVPDYVQAFKFATMGMVGRDIPFTCNCVLNYQYGSLEGVWAGLAGPCTFGEIAYQLLNQTMVYFDVVAVRDESGRKVSRGVAERMGHAH